MTAPNRNTLWAEILVDELAANGLEAACIAPGSRSTPLTVAFAAHPDVETFSHLDERSGAFFALGRGKATGRATAVVCTSGTAGANFHPAVMEANEGRAPLLVLTADRPPELQASGANQTTDQTKLYGDAVRWYRTLPEPEATPRKLRSLRVTASRAVLKTGGNEPGGDEPGPVHLNVPFRKPLEPIEVEDDVPENFSESAPLASEGRSGPFVETTRGRTTLDESDLVSLARALESADRGLLVTGPADEPTPTVQSLAALARATGFPILADPLSGHRFGPLTANEASGSNVDPQSGVTVCGGYDSYLDGIEWPDPDVVVRFGASPTSKVLRKYLADVDSRQFVVDPAGGWREAEFTASGLVVAEPTRLASALAERLGEASSSTAASERANTTATTYRERFERSESVYWDVVEAEAAEALFEGNVLRSVVELAPAGSTLFVSNSMPVRDLDRFGRPRNARLDVYGNRGVSGIDGIISTALGVGSASEAPLTLVTGDLAFYHDMNGLLALKRCGVDATIVVIDNDGGGIFHKLPIESFDPPFTDHFRTPHGLDFEPAGDLYDFEFDRFSSLETFERAYEESVIAADTQVLCVDVDAESSHRFRDQLHAQACAAVGEQSTDRS